MAVSTMEKQPQLIGKVKRELQLGGWPGASQFLAGSCKLWGMKTTSLEPVSTSETTANNFEPLGVLAARAACALEKCLPRLVLASAQNLGHLERQAEHDVRELLRQTTARGAQAKADAPPPHGPVCGQKLSRRDDGHPRTFTPRFGDIPVQRTCGDCPRCRKWRVPAAAVLGLAETAGYSPAVQDLAALLAALPSGPAAAAVAKEVAGFHDQQGRMDYRAGRRAGEPIGSGAVAATCRQTQCRFKRPGQFWSQAGDEALLCLETFWRNGRWHLLFPHAAFNPARN